MSDAPAWLRPHGPPWTIRESREVYDNPWITLTEHQATAPTGAPAVYGQTHFKNLALAVLAIHDDGSVVLVGQHRLPLANYSWEIVEGGGPLDVAPVVSAQRELAEEAGLAAAEWREVLWGELSNSVSDERAVGFIATGLSPTESAPDATEQLTLARAPFREALDQVLAGRMRDMLTVAMLLRAYQMAVDRDLPPDLCAAMLRR